MQLRQLINRLVFSCYVIIIHFFFTNVHRQNITSILTIQSTIIILHLSHPPILCETLALILLRVSNGLALYMQRSILIDECKINRDKFRCLAREVRTLISWQSHFVFVAPLDFPLNDQIPSLLNVTTY